MFTFLVVGTLAGLPEGMLGLPLEPNLPPDVPGLPGPMPWPVVAVPGLLLEVPMMTGILKSGADHSLLGSGASDGKVLFFMASSCMWSWCSSTACRDVFTGGVADQIMLQAVMEYSVDESPITIKDVVCPTYPGPNVQLWYNLTSTYHPSLTAPCTGTATVLLCKSTPI